MSRRDRDAQRHAAVLASWRALRNTPGLTESDRQLGAQIVRDGRVPNPPVKNPEPFRKSLARLKKALEIQ